MGGEIPLQRVLAQKLAERLRVPAEDCTGDDALHQVVCRYLQRGGRREDVYPRLHNLMKELALAVPESLRQLARIRHFNLFVTTTFDTLLTQALDDERFSGQPGAAKTISLAYAPNRNEDLPSDVRRGAVPTVFHLLGRLSASPDYVITEEDTLEFFTSMQTESKRPNVLLDELKSSHLLLIGNTFPGWLSRQREEFEIVADRRTQEDPGLVLFLKNLSCRTQLYEQGNAADFARELAARYAEKHPQVANQIVAGVADPGPASARPATSQNEVTVATEMKPGAVFLSYASQDAEAVKNPRCDRSRGYRGVVRPATAGGRRRLRPADQEENPRVFAVRAGDFGQHAGAPRGGISGWSGRCRSTARS